MIDNIFFKHVELCIESKRKRHFTIKTKFGRIIYIVNNIF